MKGGYRKLLIECIKHRERKGDSNGKEEERKDFYRQNGFSSEGIKALREREKDIKVIIKINERDKMEQ